MRWDHEGRAASGAERLARRASPMDRERSAAPPSARPQALETPRGESRRHGALMRIASRSRSRRKALFDHASPTPSATRAERPTPWRPPRRRLRALDREPAPARSSCDRPRGPGPLRARLEAARKSGSRWQLLARVRPRCAWRAAAAARFRSRRRPPMPPSLEAHLHDLSDQRESSAGSTCGPRRRRRRRAPSWTARSGSATTCVQAIQRLRQGIANLNREGRERLTGPSER